MMMLMMLTVVMIGILVVGGSCFDGAGCGGHDGINSVNKILLVRMISVVVAMTIKLLLLPMSIPMKAIAVVSV